MHFVTSQTVIGRRIYAMGGNEKAARLSGVNTPRLLFGTFVNMGVLAALAGLIVTARLNTATPKAGDGFELDVIAACFIGGASASGGVGKVIGAVVGAFLIGVMNNGMSILGIGIDWQQTIKGLCFCWPFSSMCTTRTRGVIRNPSNRVTAKPSNLQIFIKTQ
jgi:putative multiple sugar transport system permease protein